MDILRRFTNVTKIEKGMSSDTKYQVINEDGVTCLLRISSLDTYEDKSKNSRE